MPSIHRIFSLLFISSVFFFSSCSTEDAPDLLLINAKVWTGESHDSFEEAIAIKATKIVAVGKSEDLKKLANAKTKVIDLEGKLVTAGFNDAHIHFLSGSLGLAQVQLLGTSTPAEVADRVNQYIKDNPNKKWVTGRGWQYTSFGGGLPNAEALHAVSEDVAVFIKAYDGHSAWANKKALQLANINRTSTFDGFGEIVKDKNGEPTGALRESAMDLVSAHIPQATKEEKLDAIRKGMKLAASLGITSIQNADGSPEDIALYKTLLNNNELTVRYAASFSVDETSTDNDVALFTKIKDSIGLNNEMMRADAIKFMIDGVIESHTAFMLQPYSDISSTDPLALGKLAVPLDKYQHLVSSLDKNGFRIYTHAIGDRGVRESLNAYENAANVNGIRDARHRVEHIETVSPEDIPRFAKLNVMPSMEPIHGDPATIDVWANAIGEARLPWSFAWAEMLKHNAYLVYSSDWPACIDINPIRGIHVAVTRKTADGVPENGWVVDQKISIAQAMKAYTSAGAYSSFEENIKGKLKVGHLADVIVFSQDLFTIDPMHTANTKVLLTVFNGKIIYDTLE